MKKELLFKHIDLMERALSVAYSPPAWVEYLEQEVERLKKEYDNAGK